MGRSTMLFNSFLRWIRELRFPPKRKGKRAKPRPYQPEIERLENRCVLTALTGITEYTVPTSSSSPWMLTLGPDNNVWFTENNGNQIAKITTAGTITEYSLGTGMYRLPWDITAGPDGNLWATERRSSSPYNGIIQSTTSGSITEYLLPNMLDDPHGITAAVGVDGNLWFTVANNKVGKVTTSGTFTLYTVPTANSDPEGIALGPDGNLWFVE